jgi:Glycosyl hydrolases family 31/Domain of unknown function (DUF5110)
MSARAAAAVSLLRALLTGLIAAVLLACSGTSSGPTIVTGNARFEFLTPSLVRMEYSAAGHFVDAPSAVVLRRDWPKVSVRTTQQDGWLVAQTAQMTLRYRLQSGEFAAGNLEVTWKDAAGTVRSWHPGDKDPLNLGGLPYSLDNLSQDNLPAGRSDADTPVNDIIPGIDLTLPEAKPGLLSRAGYAFIDDSPTPVWNARRTWIEPRQPREGEDWYLFVYQADYPQVLRDYAELCGPVPMIPRYAFAPMMTDLNFEYFPGSWESQQPDLQHYNQQYLEEEVSRLRRELIPFDTLILDFAWHNYGWDGGYDWSPLIPQPHEFSQWLHQQGLKLSLNDHPGYINTQENILSPQDSHAARVLTDLGRAVPLHPSFDLDVSQLWQFAPDSHDAGLTERWYVGGHPVSARWQPSRVGRSWQAQGYPGYQGVGWYRATVRLPPQLPPKLYLYLGEVRQSYRLFVNGQEATHSSIHWPQRLTYADISRYLVPGRQNLLVLRVEPAHGEGGESDGGLLLEPVAIRDVEPPRRIYFDLSNQQQAEIFMRDLHAPLMGEGVDFWWVDGGSGAVDMPGLNEQLWTNKVFFDFTQQHSGRRGFILGRYGDWGSERYPAFFTGDTYSQWPVLAYEVAFTARGGNVLMPYISHDIGGFHGARIDFDLYARWIEFGTFSPILRMHSAHENPRDGNARMPWNYGDAGTALMRKYFTLRMQLLPYLYSYSWRAHTESMPILRPLYLAYPQLEEAYHHSHEYLFGAELLVAPVIDPSGDATIYLPPGEWLDFFSGKRYPGGTTFTAHYAVDETPVFARAGALIPEQHVSETSAAPPAEPLIINVYGSGSGHFDLYEDDGISLAYAKGAYAVTSLTYSSGGDGTHHLTIGPATGSFAGQSAQRSYELHIHSSAAPTSLAVDGRDAGQPRWDAAQATAILTLPARSVHDRIEVTWR